MALARDHVRGRVPLPARRRQRVRRGADRGRRRGRDPDHAARRVLRRRRVRRAGERGAARASPTATRRAGPNASRSFERRRTPGSAPRSTPSAPCPPTSSPRSSSGRRERPLHFHLSEQRAENEACLAAHGCTPTQLLAEHGALGPNACAVHATHLHASGPRAAGRDDDLHVPDDRARPRRRHRPRRPAALARHRQPRGHRPLRGGARGRAQPAPGHRDPRPLHGRRPPARPRPTTPASAGPTRAGIAPGALADLVTVSTSTPSASPETATRRRCSSRSSSPPPPPTSTDVIVAGRQIVKAGRHTSIDVPSELATNIKGLSL